MGFRAQGLGFRVQGLGSGDVGFGVHAFGALGAFGV